MQVSDYTGLITSEHAGKPKFAAMVAALAQCFVNQQAFLQGMPGQFDLDVAVGAQLDVLGLWIGLGRSIKVPVASTYFSWDTAGLGWGQGIWYRAGDPTDSTVLLDDFTFRVMLRAKIGANNWDGTCEDIVPILNAVFVPEGWTAVMADNQNMSMTITIAGATLPPLLAAVISGGYIPIRPAGVSVSFVLPP